ncbi:dephospho-CoA kinase-domain-containing protein [Pisolithus orientalis]|uniref:dephospho-CoA kinase-domain-containing protein n=1 Tax=Pisolithus orientalis TaxID=936130 RepID=UPI0022254683|nr:dephospho-CoA kinase-domain-containing protein [Pisolithus orientalis]KAI5997637.1 dephospho-CoA kinase-domain-containing protein [Pisolithus orientalis]
MLVVGLTGGIATGKSTVSALLSASGIPIIDADVLAREVVAPGTRALSKIAAYFGPDVILPDGSLDRKKLGSIVFNDETKRRKLNSIVHPAVTRAILWNILGCWIRGERMCVVDVPLLIEGGLWKWMGRIIVVYCSPEIQLQRLMARDKSTHAEASARLTSQQPISSKIAYADIVIDNSGSRSELEEQVLLSVKRLEHTVGRTWVVSWLLPPFGLLFAAWTLLVRMTLRTKWMNEMSR